MAKKKKYYSDETMRAMRKEDSSMIREDRSAPSNFPQKSFIKWYPDSPEAGDYAWMDDTLSGTDAQMSADARGIRKQRAKSKF